MKTQAKTLVDVDEVIINFGFVGSLGPIGERGLAVEGGSLVVDTKMETSIRTWDREQSSCLKSTCQQKVLQTLSILYERKDEKHHVSSRRYELPALCQFD